MPTRPETTPITCAIVVWNFCAGWSKDSEERRMGLRRELMLLEQCWMQSKGSTWSDGQKDVLEAPLIAL